MQRKLGKTRNRGLDRFLTHQGLHRVRVGFIGDIGGGLDRLRLPYRAAAQQIERAVMGNSKQPRPKLRHLLDLVERRERAGERILHDVLAVDHRSHQPRAVAVQFRTQLAGQSQKLRPAVAMRRGWSSVQAAAPSIMVIPVSPLRPKTTPSAYFGSSSTETTFSPNSRGGIGAPKRARNSFFPMPAARA